MNYKHGHVISKGKRSPTLECWSGMMRRCYSLNNKSYPRYGGRGISVCDRWHDFRLFLQDMGDKPDGLTIDRIDNSKGYSKDNCRWADAKTQARNRRTSLIIEYIGQRRCLAEWCELLGLPYTKTLGRITKCKWPVERAFSTFN